jgi:hypothetical protein
VGAAPQSTIVYRISPNAVLNLPSSGHVELWRVYLKDDDRAIAE